MPPNQVAAGVAHPFAPDGSGRKGVGPCSAPQRNMGKYKAPRGTQDVLPEESWRWQRLEASFREICRRYSYQEIITPLFEETELFARGVGEGTELVHKQMYTFEDRGGRSLTLRAEGTAPVMRAYLEHNLGAAGGTQKLYYLAPIFRYERPQAGRYRQHHQLGVEAIGSPGPEIDAEVIALFHDFLKEIALEGGVTHLSSIGCPQCRPAFSDALRRFFGPHIAEMCEFCQARYEKNPLRILDCKVPRDVELRAGAPSALDHLCEECRSHFTGVRASLDALHIAYEVDPTIVRGLDYYSRTAFEVVHPALAAKDVIMGGGRYDGLAEMLGGPPTPGIGFGSGLERLLLALADRGTGGEMAGVGTPALQGTACGSPVLRAISASLDLYIASASPEARLPALLLAIELRQAGLAVDLDFTNRSLRAQMREAARLGAQHTALLGEDELKTSTVTLRNMETGEQQAIPRAEAAARLRQAAT
jgi:histidyl-tRNA synthetase